MEALPPSPLYPSRGQVLRRRVLGLVLLVAIGLGVAHFAFGVDLPLIGGDSEDLSEPPALGQTVEDPKSGILIGVPEGWHESKASGAIRIESDDKSVAVLVSAPVIAKGDRIVFRDSVKAIRKSYKDVRVRNARGAELDRYPATRSVVVTGRNRAGVPVRILLSVAKGKKFAYVVEVVAARKAPTRRVVEAQTMLASLRLTK